ncbi:hypothetical protein P691DRAFT_792942 [Macrolepiota fuliginosa MF-IS2]|uniref:Uncharacterized protein n=1 Tax=Macrolepiota fuliginosa MF-IS2 TaxID=1400762 RepID=A0A9P5WZD7_9AGAR|nr:hypothetical protein P691DRAFT_792942 [Macrolepiota fuliginosa MF-IS2]
MPAPRDRSAPKFDGHPLSLKRFLDEIDTLGNTCQLALEEKIQHTIHYLEWKEYKTWRSCPTASGQDWDAFKQDIIALYPGANEDQKYTLVDLEVLANKQARESMNSRYQFGEYYRNFITITDWLLPKGEISRRERDQIFFSSFNTGFREKLATRLTLKHLDHPLHKPWPIKDIRTAANFLLVANSASNEPNLRTIPLVLNEQVMVDAILDEGSQITMLGLLRDLPVRIGWNMFYLQVQVVENSSYEMLLGQPFLTLTKACTHHYTTGDLHITLCNPNTNDTFTIPTKPRVCPSLGF